MSLALRKRRQLKVLAFFTRIVSFVGTWFGREVSNCPENDLDALLWDIFMWHVGLTRIHAYITWGWFNQWSIRTERLQNLWFYYWSFQSHEYRQKAKKVIIGVTRLYQEDKK